MRQSLVFVLFLTLTASIGHAAAVFVTEAESHSFRKHVQPIFAKLGCKSGACHGALAGKGGFRLSLRGYDPQSDYFNIVKQDRSRRTNLAEPARSLILAKPSGA